MKRIKLIWDFRGMDGHQTALHHEIHLNEFAEREELKNTKCGVEQINDIYSFAYMLVEENDMLKVRDALIPQRGEWEA